jgi:hypothetical protein
MVWWSGALTILAVVHLGRAVAGVPVWIGGRFIPIWVSVAVGSMAGVGALWLLWATGRTVRSRRRHALRLVRPGRPEDRPTAAEPEVGACCGLHAVVTADEDQDQLDEDE